MARPQSVASELLGSALSSACTWSAKRPDRPTGVDRSPSRRTDAVPAVSGQASAPSNGSASAKTTGTGGPLHTKAGDVDLRAPPFVVMETHVHGVATRSVDDVVEVTGAHPGSSNYEDSRIHAGLDETPGAFRTPLLSHVKFARGASMRPPSTATRPATSSRWQVIVATGVHADGSCERCSPRRGRRRGGDLGPPAWAGSEARPVLGSGRSRRRGAGPAQRWETVLPGCRPPAVPRPLPVPDQLAKTFSRIGLSMHEVTGRCAGLPMDLYQRADVLQ